MIANNILPSVFQLLPRVFSCNAYVFTGAENVVIDPGCGDETGLLNALANLGVKPESFKRVFYTHMHFDHVSQGILFPKAEHLMHEADAEYVNTKNSEFTAASAFHYPAVFPTITTTLKGGEVFGVNLEAIHAPGHTPGSMCYFLRREKILFSGDVIFPKNNIGRYDLPGGDYELQAKSVAEMRRLPWETLCAGHMAVEKRELV